MTRQNGGLSQLALHAQTQASLFGRRKSQQDEIAKCVRYFGQRRPSKNIVRK
jgi:hypothetical protein